MNNKLIIGLIALFAIVFVGLSSVFIVNEREQALVVQFGKIQRPVQEAGLHFKIPLMQQVIFLEKRVLSLDVRPQEVLAADQRRILVDSFARFRIVDPVLRYQAAANDRIAADLLEKIMESTVRQVLAKEPMQNIVSGERAQLMQQISDITNEQAKSIGLEVIDVRLKRVDLPAQNSQAIFQRMETERQQEAAEKRAEGNRDAVKIKADADRQVAVLVAEAEKQSQIIRGEADGQAVKIFADAFGKDEEFFEFYRTMQAYRKALGKNDTTLVLSPDSEFFKLFVNSESKK
ncbi:protease modulator HflC [Kordiimonas sp. SCSIO 12603]|uniref:protease modulator HflC n=1 Tax=Kordiimonas sp. SCSIO 12603 TaxID=2829596 RepID=UPI0021077823|nr:protease modulator HflC [Kordiimonas sp. SCSIO 12603]UTW57882.1 protease modulator HflC [Kordiimonas sp. SCSIO 12603]